MSPSKMAASAQPPKLAAPMPPPKLAAVTVQPLEGGAERRLEQKREGEVEVEGAGDGEREREQEQERERELCEGVEGMEKMVAMVEGLVCGSGDEGAEGALCCSVRRLVWRSQVWLER